MYISREYFIEPGKDAPEGTVVLKCSICGDAFAVPTTEADKLGAIQVCDGCKDVYEKQVAEEAHALMKAPEAASTQKEIDAAKGN